MSLSASVTEGDWRTPADELPRRLGVARPRWSSDTKQEPLEIVVEKWRADVTESVAFSAFGRKIKKDGTPGAFRGTVDLPPEDVPDEVRGQLLALLWTEAARQKEALDAATRALASVAGPQGEG